MHSLVTIIIYKYLKSYILTLCSPCSHSRVSGCPIRQEMECQLLAVTKLEENIKIKFKNYVFKQ